MPIVYYVIKGQNGHHFSPFAWRARMALAHKGLPVETRGISFTDIPKLSNGAWKTVPTIVDGDRIVTDSLKIADYLEKTYPEAPSLFGGAAGRSFANFVQAWTNTVLHPLIARCVLFDMHQSLLPQDKDYFWNSRGELFGMPLDKFCADQEGRSKELRRVLGPLRQVLGRQSFLGGDAPLYADYIVFGAFQWARSSTPFELIAADDEIAVWFRRCLDLYGGLAREAPAHAWLGMEKAA